MDDKNKTDFFDDDNITQAESNKDDLLKSGTSERGSNKDFIISQIKSAINDLKEIPFYKKINWVELVFFLVAIASIIVSIILASKNQTTGALIGAGIFTLSVIGIIIFVSAKERKALKKPKENYTIMQAKVIGCGISSQKAIGNRFIETYKVLLEIDGEQVESYSRKFLREGLIVNVYVRNGKPKKWCYIEV